jgi:hypothetical protein
MMKQCANADDPESGHSSPPMLAAMLALRGRGRFTDADVADVTQLALTGLAHQPAA